MAKFSVSYPELDSLASRLRAAAESAENQYGSTMSLLQSVVSGDFVTDRSSDVLQEQLSRFRAESNAAIATLIEIASYFEAAARAYQDVDTQLAQALGRDERSGRDKD